MLHQSTINRVDGRLESKEVTAHVQLVLSYRDLGTPARFLREVVARLASE